MFKNDIFLEEHHGTDVWTHTKMDTLRKTECLCLNCAEMQSCQTAKTLHNICVVNNMAMMITRCRSFKEKDLQYKRKCIVCEDTEFFTMQSGSHTGLYCASCRSWQKWLSKSEIKEYCKE